MKDDPDLQEGEGTKGQGQRRGGKDVSHKNHNGAEKQGRKVEGFFGVCRVKTRGLCPGQRVPETCADLRKEQKDHLEKFHAGMP